MKKIALLAVALIALCTTTVSAQGFGWGVKAGINVANINDLQGDSKAGFTAGVFADYKFGRFALSADLLYSREGAKGDHDSKIKSNYLNIPILANYYIVGGLAVKAGIQPGFLLSAKGGDESITDAFHTMDFAIPVGVSYEIFDRIIVDARYNFGLAKIIKDSTLKSRNNVFALTVGYRF